MVKAACYNDGELLCVIKAGKDELTILVEKRV